MDFIADAIKALHGEPSNRDLKKAVVFLDAGVELLLKQRLLDEHWSLVFRDPGAADRDKFESGDFQSASFDDCIARLIRVSGWEIEDRDRRKLNQFRKHRNRLAHLGILGNAEAIRAAAATVLSFILDFVCEHFRIREESAEATLLAEIREDLAEFQRFVDTRWKAIEREVDEHEPIVAPCEVCGQSAVVADRTRGYRCRFCGHQCDAEDATRAYLSMQGGYDVSQCPECAQTLIDEGPGGGPQEHRYLCFGCGRTWADGQLHSCLKCGELFEPTDEMTVCDDCFEATVAND